MKLNHLSIITFFFVTLFFQINNVHATCDNGLVLESCYSIPVIPESIKYTSQGVSCFEILGSQVCTTDYLGLFFITKIDKVAVRLCKDCQLEILEKKTMINLKPLGSTMSNRDDINDDDDYPQESDIQKSLHDDLQDKLLTYEAQRCN